MEISNYDIEAAAEQGVRVPVIDPTTGIQLVDEKGIKMAVIFAAMDSQRWRIASKKQKSKLDKPSRGSSTEEYDRAIRDTLSECVIELIGNWEWDGVPLTTSKEDFMKILTKPGFDWFVEDILYFVGNRKKLFLNQSQKLEKYVKQLAWLNTCKKGYELPRNEMIPKGDKLLRLPDIKHFEYIIELLMQSGGLNRNIGWADIEAWKSATGTPVCLWESELIIKLSNIFNNYVSKYSNSVLPSPMAETVINQEELQSKIKMAIRASAPSPKKKRPGE